jgi:hypothetical protein
MAFAISVADAGWKAGPRHIFQTRTGVAAVVAAVVVAGAIAGLYAGA